MTRYPKKNGPGERLMLLPEPFFDCVYVCV